ncbi:hypothetical protein [Microbulbifer sp.]|uniref:hypothetical protein n=1 Tax=Microbulbifer sp. TaxID=1908541 RepID=UPI00258FFDBA|nr:hypothetical protein [Microbulbifer sp.]
MLSFLAISGCFAVLFSLLLHYGLVIDAAEWMPALESSASAQSIVDLGITAVLLCSFILVRHYLLLLSFVKSLRVAFRRFLRTLQPPTPALCSVPYSAHGSRAPPFHA